MDKHEVFREKVEQATLSNWPHEASFAAIQVLAYYIWQQTGNDANSNWYAAINAVRAFYFNHGFPPQGELDTPNAPNLGVPTDSSSSVG